MRRVRRAATSRFAFTGARHVSEAAELSVHSEYSWARGGNFLTRNVTVKRAGETTLESWQIIGWDPVEERIRSWTFDGEGGFGRLVDA
jgi:hypothetical protein